MKSMTSLRSWVWTRRENHFSDYLKLGDHVILQWEVIPEVWVNHYVIWKMGTFQETIEDCLDQLSMQSLLHPGRSWRLVRRRNTAKVILTFKG